MAEIDAKTNFPACTQLIKRVNTPLPELLLIHLHPESYYKILNYVPHLLGGFHDFERQTLYL